MSGGFLSDVRVRTRQLTPPVRSLGITAIELADGKPPRANLTAYQAMKAIAKDPPPTLSSPSKWSEPFRQFVQYCLVPDPGQGIRRASHV